MTHFYHMVHQAYDTLISTIYLAGIWGRGQMIPSTYVDRVIISVLFYNTIHFCLLMLYHSNPTRIENNLIFPHERIFNQLLTFSCWRKAVVVLEARSQTLAGPLFPKETRYFPSGLQDNKVRYLISYITNTAGRMYKILFFPFYGSCNLRVILVHAINLKSRSFTDLWALASSRIITMLGHFKTLKFPSCTTQNSDSHHILYLHEPRHILEKIFSNGIDEA